MARLSQKQLEELAEQRKLENRGTDDDTLGFGSSETEKPPLSNPKIINEILNDGMRAPYKYKLPETPISFGENDAIPYVRAEDYPKIKIKGKFAAERQIKGANLYLVKEIDYLLKNVNEGKNKNATINFLIWVGLQSLKGINHDISVQIHDSTYADGSLIERYLSKELIES